MDRVETLAFDKLLARSVLQAQFDNDREGALTRLREGFAADPDLAADGALRLACYDGEPTHSRYAATARDLLRAALATEGACQTQAA